MVALNHKKTQWDLLSEDTLDRIMKEIVVKFRLKGGVASSSLHKVYLLQFLRKLFSSLSHPHVLKVGSSFTAMPIAIRFSRLTIKEMLMEEEEEEEEESLTRLWISLSKLAQRLYHNPKVVFLHNLINDFWEVIEEDVAKEIVQFLIVLVSQNETRKFVKYLIKDSVFIVRFKYSHFYEDNEVLRGYIDYLESYLFENEEA
jgi:phosphoglycolate phosphatase-like HAD superfamily hydrolase